MLPTVQEIFCPVDLSKWSPMGKLTIDHTSEGFARFRAGVASLMSIREIKSHSELARIVSKKGGDVSKRTVNNALAGRHDPQISTLQAISDALDCPLWVLFLVGHRSEELQSPARERLIAMVNAYLMCTDSDRHHVESLSAAFAAKNKDSK
jgi:transcriptional regulator with XRE-family HTH domain